MRLAAGAAVLLMTAALALSGCGSEEAPEPPPAREITVPGLGRTAQVEIAPADAAREIGLPVYPGGTLIKGERLRLKDSSRGEVTYNARYNTPAAFDDVVKWYEQRLDERAVRAKLSSTRYALISGGSRNSQTRTVTVSRRDPDHNTAFTLTLLIAEQDLEERTDEP